METVDDETSAAAIDFMKRQHDAGQPFFTWYNTTRMHARTHVREEHRSPPGLTALTEYADGMIEHDALIGEVLESLDEMGIADNTIVLYTTDNGPHQNTWPDAGTTPFRSEKNTNWEGAYRVPAMIRWPGHIPAGVEANDIVSGLDWFPTLLAAAGDTDITERLLAGTTIDGKEYKNHLDGYNQLPYLTGESDESARDSFVYLNDDGDIVGFRYENWKLVFEEQRAKGTMQIWAEPFTKLRVPKMFDLRADPYEIADITSNTYYDWLFAPRLSGGAGASLHRGLPRHLRGVPAGTAAGELLDRPDPGEHGRVVQERRRRAVADENPRRGISRGALIGMALGLRYWLSLRMGSPRTTAASHDR